MNFKLKSPNSKTGSLILFYSNLPDGKRFVFSTGQKIPVRLWDKNAQLPKKTKSQNDQIIVNTVNNRLDQIRSEYFKLYHHYKGVNKILTKDVLKNEFKILFKGTKRAQCPKSFKECFNDFVQFKKTQGIWSSSTTVRYNMIYKLLKEFEQYNGPIYLEEINEKWMSEFKSYCENSKAHQINTLGRNIGLIKTFLNYCLKNGYIENNDFKDFTIKREVTDQLALSKNDIHVIAQLDLSANKRLERVRDVFLLGCYTGMRYSDYKRIKAANLTANLIKIREVKDKTKFLEIPITNRIKAILDKYNMNLPKISEQNFRVYLKEIFQIAGFTEPRIKSVKIGNKVFEKEVPMYELMSTHTARRSFITIMLNSGVPAKAIMKITGHKSINNFQLYYKPTNENLSNFMRMTWD